MPWFFCEPDGSGEYSLKALTMKAAAVELTHVGVSREIRADAKLRGRLA
jgi:hypothetical protein